MTQDAYFSLLTHTKQLLLVTFCDKTAGIRASFHVRGLASPCPMEPKGLRVTQNVYFSLLTHTKQFFLMMFCDKNAGIGASSLIHGQTDKHKQI